MPIREESFRIGCGRYVQKPNLLHNCGEEILRLGNAPLIVGGKTALQITRETMISSICDTCTKYEIIEHCGTCNEEQAGEIAAFAKENGFDVIVGVGGGVLMDFSKLCGHLARLPVINIPTSSATCAAYTPLSVCYTPEGHTIGTLHYQHEVDAVLVDTAVLLAQPVRLLLAGVFDALAKFIEIKQRFWGDISKDYPMGLDYAYVMAKHSFDLLNQKTAKCIADMAADRLTADVENVIFTTVAATGVISSIARGSNQCALAHKFYETTRTLFPETARPYLHGEIVGIGLLLQNHFNGETENNEVLLALMKENGMPCCISDVSVEPSEEVMEEYYRRIRGTSAVAADNEEECRRFAQSLRYLWSLK